MLAQLRQNTTGALRMKEGNVQTLSTLAGLLINEADTLLADLGKTFGNTIFYAECYMMNAFVALVKPLLDVLSGDVGSNSSSFTSPQRRKAVFTFWSSTTSVA